MYIVYYVRYFIWGRMTKTNTSISCSTKKWLLPHQCTPFFKTVGSPEIDWDCPSYVHTNLCTSYVKVCLNLTRLNVKHFQMFDRSSSSKWKQNFAIIFPPEEAEVYQLVDLLFEQDWSWESLPPCWGSLEEASITSFMRIILNGGLF